MGSWSSARPYRIHEIPGVFRKQLEVFLAHAGLQPDEVGALDVFDDLVDDVDVVYGAEGTVHHLLGGRSLADQGLGPIKPAAGHQVGDLIRLSGRLVESSHQGLDGS